MADVAKDGLGIICILPGFDYATACDSDGSHVKCILPNACLVLTVSKILLWQWPWKCKRPSMHATAASRLSALQALYRLY